MTIVQIIPFQSTMWEITTQGTIIQGVITEVIIPILTPTIRVGGSTRTFLGAIKRGRVPIIQIDP